MSTMPTEPTRFFGCHGNPMSDLDDLLDSLAQKVAEKVTVRLAQAEATGPRQKLFSVEQAATYLGRTPEAVRHMISSGKLTAVRIDTRISLDKEDLDKLICQSKETGY